MLPTVFPAAGMLQHDLIYLIDTAFAGLQPAAPARERHTVINAYTLLGEGIQNGLLSAGHLVSNLRIAGQFRRAVGDIGLEQNLPVLIDGDLRGCGTGIDGQNLLCHIGTVLTRWSA